MNDFTRKNTIEDRSSRTNNDDTTRDDAARSNRNRARHEQNRQGYNNNYYPSHFQLDNLLHCHHGRHGHGRCQSYPFYSGYSANSFSRQISQTEILDEALAVLASTRNYTSNPDRKSRQKSRQKSADKSNNNHASD